MHAVVTGAAGFIGSHLVERLLGDGWDVVGVDAFTPYYDRAAKEANLAGVRSHARFDLVEADVAAAPWAQLLRHRPTVFHLAAQPGVRGSFGDGFADYVRHNLIATQHLLEAATEAGCARVVVASSSSVYGDAEAHPYVEDVTPTRPRSPYGATKRATEDLCDIYTAGPLAVSCLRYFTVYGPRQRPDMAMRRLCESAVTGATFTLHGDGGQSRDFTFVTDAVDATVRAGTTATPPRVVNVGGGEEATMHEVVATVERLAGAPLPLVRTGDQRGDVRRTAADTTLARRTLGWAPTVALADGLAAELAWVRARHDERATALVGSDR